MFTVSTIIDLHTSFSSETTFSPEELLGMLFDHSRGTVEDFAGNTGCLHIPFM